MSEERAKKAMAAMKMIGFTVKQTKPVLKNLYELFNRNWEPIEDDNYQALVDAILDAQDSTPAPAPASQQGTQVINDEWEPHGGTRDGQHYSISANYNDMGDDDNESPLVKRPKMCAVDSGLKSLEPRPPQTIVSTRIGVPPSPQTKCRLTRSLTHTRQDVDREDAPAITKALILEVPEPENNVGDGFTCPEDVLAYPHARPLNIDSSGGKGLLTEHCKMREMTTLSAGVRRNIVNQAWTSDSSLHAAPTCKAGVSTIDNTQDTSSLEFDVASSTTGEVKMSLRCNLDPSKVSLNMEEVLKMVEEKCLHTYKMLPPNFSIAKLLNEVCQSVAELGTMPSNVCSNGGSLQKEADAPFVMPIACKTAADGTDSAAGGSTVLGPLGTCLENSMVAWEPKVALCKQRAHDVDDISKGQERYRISIVNEFGSESCPPSFYYIPRNIVFQNAYVSVSIARIGDEDCCADCSGNCLLASLPCACARATGGEFAYTPEGRVRTAFLDECISVNHFPEKQHRFYCQSCPLEKSKDQASPGPCKGHLVRKFIKECWSKCGCGMQCGNRVIQHGITSKLQVFYTHEGKGWGLRTVDELPRGSFVCEYAGEVLTSAELYERTVETARNGKHMHQVLLDADWGSGGTVRDEEALSLDATFYGNVGRFINHSCYDANLVQIPVEVDTPDHHYYHLAFFTTRKVEPFEELTWDYGIDFEDVDGPSKAFRCMCGSRRCRDPNNPRRRSKAAARRN